MNKSRPLRLPCPDERREYIHIFSHSWVTSPGSSAMRCLLSRDGNRRKGEEGRRKRMGFCKKPLLSFVLGNKRYLRFPATPRRCRQEALPTASGPLCSAVVLFCWGMEGMVASKSIGVFGERRGYLGSRSGITVDKHIFC